jgi:integrase
MKLSATVKEAVADVHVEVSQEESAETRPGPSGSRTCQSGRPEQFDVCDWAANLRARHSRVQRGYAPATIILRLAAVRRIAYEAADAGLLSPELAAGIRRVKGVRRIGVRLSNWLTPEQGRRLLDSAAPSTARQLRDHANVAMLIGYGLRRTAGSSP